MPLTLPALLPSELLFSRIIRLLVQTGFSAAQIQYLLFSNSRISINPLLVPLSDALSDCSGEEIASLYTQTLGRIFEIGLPGKYPPVENILRSKYSYYSSWLWKFPNHRGLQNPILKSCNKCISQDIYTYGVAYWHREHQIPNVVACHLHSLTLNENKLLRRYHLAAGLPSSTTLDVYAKQQDVEYAMFVASVLTKQSFSSKSHVLAHIFKNLMDKGFLTKRKQLKRQLICKSFYNEVSTLTVEHSYYSPESATDFRFLRSLLSPENYSHPGRLLIFLFWLSKHENAKIEVEANHSQKANSKDELEQRCVLYLNQGYSLNQVSKIIHKSRTYVKSVALRAGITDRFNPKRIDQTMRNKIVAMAYKGWHRRFIAKTFSVSEGSVEMIISSIPELVKYRKRCKYESKRRSYRVEILRFIDNNADCIRQDIFDNCNAAAHWLFGNDRGWYDENMPAPLLPKFSNK
jgi:transposase|tara:strand:+ start:7209 stop:8594 length:1386 start_codon:yes stop_codon:yes gene_type:complete